MLLTADKDVPDEEATAQRRQDGERGQKKKNLDGNVFHGDVSSGEKKNGKGRAGGAGVTQQALAGETKRCHPGKEAAARVFVCDGAVLAELAAHYIPHGARRAALWYFCS